MFDAPARKTLRSAMEDSSFRQRVVASLGRGCRGQAGGFATRLSETALASYGLRILVASVVLAAALFEARHVAAALLVAASALKAHQVATDPVAWSDNAASSLISVGLVVGELGVALWATSG